MENHERETEQARVDNVEKQIDQQVAATTKAVEDAHRETRAVERNYSENASMTIRGTEHLFEQNT